MRNSVDEERVGVCRERAEGRVEDVVRTCRICAGSARRNGTENRRSRQGRRLQQRRLSGTVSILRGPIQGQMSGE